MGYTAAVTRYERWQERWRDPVLTALLVLLSLEVFVAIPTSHLYSVDASAFVVVWFLLIVPRRSRFGGKRQYDEADRRMQCAGRSCQPCLDLKAARLIAYTPFAEVLAIVGQQPVAVLAHPGQGPAHHLAAIEILRRIESDPDRLTTGETSERNFFHRPSAQTVRESRVMHHLATTDVNSMVEIASAPSDQMRTQRGFALCNQLPLGSV